jgi:hypothetical protein
LLQLRQPTWGAPLVTTKPVSLATLAAPRI